MTTPDFKTSFCGNEGSKELVSQQMTRSMEQNRTFRARLTLVWIIDFDKSAVAKRHPFNDAAGTIEYPRALKRTFIFYPAPCLNHRAAITKRHRLGGS